MVRANPVDDGGAVVLRLNGVAQDGVLQPLADSIEDEIGRSEVHVGDPHRQQVVFAVLVAVHREPFPQRIGLQRTAPAPVYERIKKELHNIFSIDSMNPIIPIFPRISRTSIFSMGMDREEKNYLPAA